MKVKEVMHSGITSASPDTPIAEIAKKMRDDDVGAVPIGEDGHIVGMVTDRDIACRGIADGKDAGKTLARDVMSKPLYFCRSDEEVEDAVQIMEKYKIRRLPVLDDNDRAIGMLALGDIAKQRDLSSEVLKAVAEHHR